MGEVSRKQTKRRADFYSDLFSGRRKFFVLSVPQSVCPSPTSLSDVKAAIGQPQVVGGGLSGRSSPLFADLVFVAG